jgi:N-acetylmuramoyl-L-alanine amidase
MSETNKTATIASLSTLDVLARTLWGEARGQGRAGIEAVASVIANRARNPRWWGRDIRSVCLEGNGAQFSCWAKAPVGELDELLTITGGDPAYTTCLAVAAQAMAGKLADPTHNADSYANLHVEMPYWAVGKTPCAVIGAHSFFRIYLPAPTASKIGA